MAILAIELRVYLNSEFNYLVLGHFTKLTNLRSNVGSPSNYNFRAIKLGKWKMTPTTILNKKSLNPKFSMKILKFSCLASLKI